MQYSIEETIALTRRWKESASIVRVIFSDTALGGTLTALVIEPTSSLPTGMVASVSLKLLLPNGIPGSSLIDVHFWGSEEIEFTDFTDAPIDLVPSDNMERFTCCIAIKYEFNSLVTLCEAWPDPRLEILRGPDSAFMEFLKRNKSK
jgi:hypothetical protein